MPKVKRKSGNFAFDVPKQKGKRRKGSATSYRIPAEARERQKIEAYIKFQSSPHLNAVTDALHRDHGQCDVVFGGKRAWLRKEHPKNPLKTISFPFIIDGRRCPNFAVSSLRRDGKTMRRCREHPSFDIDWIKEDPMRPNVSWDD